MRILVIEDNSDAREALVMGLRLDGQEVYEARTGAEGLDVVSQEQPELVLIDIGLPDLDGYEVARRLRRKGGRKLRLVALTGYGQADDARRAYAAGFDLHVVKPIDPDRLADAVATVVNGAPRAA